MILILTVTGPEKRLPIIAAANMCVCLWVGTHSGPSTMHVRIHKVCTEIIFPRHSAKVPIDPLQQTDHQLKQRGSEEKVNKNKQSLFTSAKTSL